MPKTPLSTKALLAILLTAALAATPALAAPPETGSLCAAPYLPRKTESNPHRKSKVADSDPNPIYEVQVDDLAPVEMSSTQGHEVKGLSLSTQHQIKVRVHETFKNAFHFRFMPNGPKRLCLVHNRADSSWEILDPGKSFKDRCRCETSRVP